MAGAVLWSLPILAAGLLTLLRYSFGSLFVIGESVAMALLSGAGADIAGTMAGLQEHPWRGVAASALGLLLAVCAAGMALRRLEAAALLAGASAAWAWQCGMPAAGVVLLAGCATGTAVCLAARP